MRQHPVKELIHLLYAFLFFPFFQIAKNTFFHFYRKFFIIYTILRKVFNMYHAALASVQCTKCLSVRALHFLHFPHPSDTDSEFCLNPSLKLRDQTPRTFYKVDSLLIRICRNRTRNNDWNTVGHDRTNCTGKIRFHNIPNFSVKFLCFYIHTDRADQSAVLIRLTKLQDHDISLLVFNVQKLLVIICRLHFLLKKQTSDETVLHNRNDCLQFFLNL